MTASHRWLLLLVGVLVLVPATVSALSHTVQWSASTSSHSEGAGTVAVTVTLSTLHTEDVTVDVAITGGTATGGGTDLTLDPTTVTIPAASLSADAKITLTSDTIDEPDETVDLTISNPTGGATLGTPTTHTLTITDDDPNNAPTAADQSGTTDEDSPLSDGLSASDPDPGDTLTYAVSTGPSKGSLTLDTATGAFTYTPNANANGADSFTWTATDNHGAVSNTATYSITINAVNDAPVAGDDAASTNEDASVLVAVLANDGDVEGDALSIASAGTPSSGTAVVESGQIRYTPNGDFNGADSFSYTVSDGALSDTATVSITVNAVNDAPVATDDAAATSQDTAVTIGVLANDGDVDGDTLSVSGTTSPSNGQVAVNPDGTITYTPNAGFSGADSFTYTASDGALEDTATVAVTVSDTNDPPVATDDTAATDEDTPATVDVLANDDDPDGNALSVSGTTSPTHGSVTVNQDGTITYAPNPNFEGADSFTYTVSDGELTDTGTVSVTVSSVNDAPVARDDAATTDEDTPVTVEVVANDGDVDGDTLAIASATVPGGGTVSLNNDGTVTYTPEKDFNGADSFTYTVSDGSLTDTATVSITVNPVADAPTAVDDAATTDEDTSGTVDVLANDADGDGDPIEITAVGEPSKGSASLNADGTVTYTPNADSNGADSFTYTVSDGSFTDTATVSVTVNPVNDAPVAQNDPTVTLKNTSVTIAVLANDGDVDGDALGVQGTSGASNGSVQANGDGTVTYTPKTGFTGFDSFTYTVSDGTLTAEGRVPVEVVDKNDAPVARDDEAETHEDRAVPIDVLANDEDPNGNVLRVLSVTAPDRGTVSIDGLGTVRYTPDPGFSGTDTFRYTVTDGSLGAEAKVTVTVRPLNDAPVARDDEVETQEDRSVWVDVLANDDDPEGETLSIERAASPGHGSVTLHPNDTITYTPDANFHGEDSFSYTVSDGELPDTATVTVTVRPVNDPPVARDDEVRTTEATPVDIRVLDNDEDVDGDPLEVVSVTKPVSGEVEVTSYQLVRKAPVVGFTGRASFRYTVTDGEYEATATVAVTVEPSRASDLPPGIEGNDATGATTLRTKGASAEFAWPGLPAAEGYQLWRWTGSEPPSSVTRSARSETASTPPPSWGHLATLPAENRTYTVPRPDPGEPPAWYKVTWFPSPDGEGALGPGDDPTVLAGWNSTNAIRVAASDEGVPWRPQVVGLDWAALWITAGAAATVGVRAHGERR